MYASKTAIGTVLSKNIYGSICTQSSHKVGKRVYCYQQGVVSSDLRRKILSSLPTVESELKYTDCAPDEHVGCKLPSVHVLGDFNFKDIDWPDRLSKSGSTLSQSEGQILIDIMNDHGLEQMVDFPTREKNTLDLILTTLPDQFKDVHSPDKLSDHDIVSGTLKIFTPTPPNIETSEKGVSISER